MLQRVNQSSSDEFGIQARLHLAPFGVVAGKLVGMPREGVERLPGELHEIGFVLVVRRHQRLFEEVVEGAPGLGDRNMEIVRVHRYAEFFGEGCEMHIWRVCPYRNTVSSLIPSRTISHTG